MNNNTQNKNLTPKIKKKRVEHILRILQKVFEEN